MLVESWYMLARELCISTYLSFWYSFFQVWLVALATQDAASLHAWIHLHNSSEMHHNTELAHRYQTVCETQNLLVSYGFVRIDRQFWWGWQDAFFLDAFVCGWAYAQALKVMFCSGKKLSHDAKDIAPRPLGKKSHVPMYVYMHITHIVPSYIAICRPATDCVSNMLRVLFYMD